MFKFLHILVITFLFFIIFSFSHVLFLFNFEIIADFFGRGGYEGIKSGITLVYGMLFGIWLTIYLYRYQLYKEGKQIIKWIGILFFFILISSLLSINIVGSFIGLSEKYHGFLFFTSLILFFTSIYFGYEKEDYKKLLNVIFLFSIPVYLYAIMQWIGYDPLNSLYETKISATKTISFLGNSNYLAGYVLILLPISKFILNNILKNLFLVISLIVLISTGSYTGIFLGALYLLYLLFSFNKSLFNVLLVFFIIGFAFIVNSFTNETLGYFKVKPYIWQSTISATIENPKTILLGYGPDTLQLVFDEYKVPELSKKEALTYTVDRSYNVFIDLIFFFGIMGGGLISYFFIKSLFISKDKEIKISILLFLLFFSFNIPISIHYLFILFLLSGVYSKNL